MYRARATSPRSDSTSRHSRLRWFEEYYDIAYPGQKVDLIALPDFGAGAMENLGCITFRENLLLVDPATATPAEEQLVADVVAHELAHMWFGDLVTMRWWNGIWLNEAFATFMEVAACDAFRPDWQRWTNFSLARSSAFEVDALESTRPVEFEVLSPTDAEGMFDVLTYEKGGALLRMLELHLGPEGFRDGVRLYLKRHAYGNTETSDLWDAIEEATGQPVRRIMDSWIWQRGYPIIEVTSDHGRVAVEQRRFLFDNDQADVTIWSVPLGLRQLTERPVTERMLLEGDRLVTSLSSRFPVVANAEAAGFFRVQYEPAALRALISEHLSHLSPIERYELVDDAWSAVVAGSFKPSDFCDAIQGFSNDRNLPVWQAIAPALTTLERSLTSSVRERFQAYVRVLVGPALADLGWTPTQGEGDLTGELRGVLIGLMGALGNDQATQQTARDVMSAAHADQTSVNAVVAAAALRVVSATGVTADYEAGLERYRAETNPQIKLRELYSLGAYPSPELAMRTLEFAMTDEVRTQNAPFLIARVLGHRDHGGLAWTFIRQRWAELNARFPSNTIHRMVDPLRNVSDPSVGADAHAFFGEYDIPQAAKQLRQTLERQSINAALGDRTATDLAQRFA